MAVDDADAERDDSAGDKVKKLDAASVRALAHPLRVRLLSRLRFQGPDTATGLARGLGESSGATSYHLRALARAGFVEEVPGRGRGRERWWRSAHEYTSWRAEDFVGDPEALAAEEWLSGSQGRQAMAWIDEWLTRRPGADADTLALADQSDYRFDVTPDEARALVREVGDVVLRHRRAAASAAPSSSSGAGGPAGPRRPLRLLVFALPVLDDDGDPGGGGAEGPGDGGGGG